MTGWIRRWLPALIGAGSILDLTGQATYRSLRRRTTRDPQHH